MAQCEKQVELLPSAVDTARGVSAVEIDTYGKFTSLESTVPLAS